MDALVRQGLFDEVRALLAAGVPADCTAMQASGYKEAVAAVRGEASPQDAVAAIQLASRRYACLLYTSHFSSLPRYLWPTPILPSLTSMHGLKMCIRDRY